jgi:hypothetical protein
VAELLRVVTPATCRTERDYVLAVVLGDWLGLQYERRDGVADCVSIELPNGSTLELADEFFARAARAWLAPETLPVEPLLNWATAAECPGAGLDLPVPLLFATTTSKSGFVRRSPGRTRCDVDLLGSIFFVLTRYEELAFEPRDGYGRFAARQSLAGRQGFIERPVANEYLEILWNLLAELCPNLTRSKRRYRLVPTHDVDSPSGAAHYSVAELAHALGGDLLKRRSASLALRRVIAACTAPFGAPRLDPHDTFDFIMRESERAGVRSAFYFICGHSGGRIDGNYDIDEPWIGRLLARIGAAGHELGLHPSFNTWTDPDAVGREFDRLVAAAKRQHIVQDAWGGRQHFLRWQVPATWRCWAAAKLSYDSSVGFADHVGFRSGTCYPHAVYDARARQPIALIERPLVAMEGSLLQRDYMNLPLAAAVARMIDLARTCRRYDGEFVFLWHNHFLIEKAQRAAYRTFLAEAA